MKVFSNTTPFIALAAIGQLELLPQLFGQVHVVEEVFDECAAGGLIFVPPLREFNWIETVQAQTAKAPHVLLELEKRRKGDAVGRPGVQCRPDAYG